MKASNVPFGFRTVPLDRKQAMVDDVFHRVASRYDLMNDLMSGGLHRVWKDAMVSWLAPPRGRPGYRALDVAGGTGDVGFRVAARTGGSAAVAVSDINEAMLAVGRERAARRADAENVSFVLANAESLPFASGSQNAYLIAFGIRNVARREAALAEAARVLRPGGRFLCLEFSQVDLPYVQRVYDFYSFEVIPRLGRVVAGDDEPYRYLVESIRTFPNPARFAAEIELAGLSRVTHRSYAGGIAAIHSAFKL